MNKLILKLLIDANGEFVSGQKISDELGITRAAIWKRMNKLKEMGFEIESVTKKGYKLVSYPDFMNNDLIETGIDLKKIGSKVITMETVESTNDFAKQIARDEQDGTIVISEEQTKGKGRRGRFFYSGSKEGIYISLILKPQIEPSKASFLTSIAAAALAKTLNELNVEVGIKWPNDVLIDGKKICGILTEMSADVESVEYIILGMGINIKGESFPEEIKDIATSLKIQGYNIGRLELLWRFLPIFEDLYLSFVDGDKNEILKILKEYSCILGKEIYVHYQDKVEKGKAIDITKDGTLVVEFENEEIKELNSGEVSIRWES